MKVCLMNESFPPVLDGVANVVINYANYLQKDFGSQVIVGTPRYPNANYHGYDYPVIAYESFDTAASANGYRTGNPLAEKEVSALAAFAPDIIHSHCPATATIISRLLRERTGAPIVFTYHTKYDIDLRRVFKLKPMADESIKAMVSNIEACDDIWVVSRGAGESLKALGYRGDYIVMNNGVDFDRGRVADEDVAKATEGYDLPEGIPMFLFVGRIITYKGIPIILDALKQLSDSGQDFRMVFIGKGPDMEEMQRTARDYGFTDDNEIPGKCIFTGPIYDRDVLRAWNTRADLFLFPSTFDTNGLVVREAAACGLASVLIKGSCAAEDVTDGRNGFTIDENADSMAAFLKEACRDIPHLHEVGDRAMNEIYMSWKDAVGVAYDRYQVVLENYRKGIGSQRHRQMTDYLIQAVASTMEHSDKARQVRHEFFDNFQETAIGMRDNFEETGEIIGNFIDDLTAGKKMSRDPSINPFLQGLGESRQKLQGFMEESTQKLQTTFDETTSEIRKSMNEKGAAIKQSFSDASDAIKKTVRTATEEELKAYNSMTDKE
ncbi:MAG TPA: glycosyl transferase [Lachnospiraceae bacterium]|nr:glycosyl transferase [Lachnospiraceae bacterium]